MSDDLLLTTVGAETALEQAGADQTLLLTPQAISANLEQSGITDAILITAEILSSELEAPGLGLLSLLTPAETVTTASSDQVTDIVMNAAIALSGHRVIRATAAGAVYADPSDPPNAVIIGISLHAANKDEDISIRAAGVIVEPSWSFVEGPVCLGPNGMLTQSPPTSGKIVEIGVPKSPKALLVRVQQVFVHG